MKKNRKGLIALVLCLAMLFSLAACGTATETAAVETAAPAATPEPTEEPEEETTVLPYAGTAGSEDDYFIPVVESIDSFETTTTTLYMNDLEKTSEIEIGILNDMADIPYLSLETIAQMLIDLHRDDNGETAFNITVDDATGDGTCFILMRENDSAMVVDCNAGTITFSDMDTFVQNPNSTSGLDIVDTGEQDGKPLITHMGLFYRAGAAEVIDLAHYGITAVAQDGACYLPMQTVADLLFSRTGIYLLYNGEAMFLADGIEDPNVPTDEEMEEEEESPDDTTEEAAAETPAPTEAPQEDAVTLSDIYYSVEKGEKSDALARFTYNELCLALDYNYGLQDAHNITSFNQLFLYSGLSDQLLSTDAGETYRGVAKLTGYYFNDFHSGMSAPSYLTDLDTYNDSSLFTSSYGHDFNAVANFSLYGMYRNIHYPDGPVGYEEVGDTAYITFDVFNFDPSRDYYNTEITNNPNDTIELIIYANSQIKREGSPIKNVVVDLSCNGGGYVDTAVCVLSWMLNGVNLNFVDPITGNEATTVYRFDANLNGVDDVDMTDSVCSMAGYHLFAIISPNSFSCGNLVPSMLDESNMVTLIGRSSGGGACCVLPLSTADGTVFQISGPYRISTVRNGSYYSVDQGVEPDVYISNIHHMYDREYLTDLIDNLA